MCNVYSFEYLGRRVQCDGGDMADVEYRLNIAQSVFSSLSNIWSDYRLSIHMKIRLYQTAVCSTLTHSCEAWTLNDEVSRKVNRFNSRCLHVITGDHYRAVLGNTLLEVAGVVLILLLILYSRELLLYSIFYPETRTLLEYYLRVSKNSS